MLTFLALRLRATPRSGAGQMARKARHRAPTPGVRRRLALSEGRDELLDRWPPIGSAPPPNRASDPIGDLEVREPDGFGSAA